MLNGIIWMTILQDGAPTNWRVLWLWLWIKTHYGMTMASLATSWYVIASYRTPACPHRVFLSRLPMAFLAQTFTSCYHRTFSTKSLKAHSKITWWPGSQLISISSTLQLTPNGFSLTLTSGKSSHSCFFFNGHDSPNTFSIAVAPSFPGLRRFPEGRGFKQWTGDDSKVLMKVCNTLQAVLTIFMTCHPDSQVYLPAIAGHVPSQMVRAISSFCHHWGRHSFYW